MDGCLNGWMDGWMNRGINKWMDGFGLPLVPKLDPVLKLIQWFLCSSRFNGETKESSFSVGLQGIATEDVDKVTDIIWKTLEKVAE